MFPRALLRSSARRRAPPAPPPPPPPAHCSGSIKIACLRHRCLFPHFCVQDLVTKTLTTTINPLHAAGPHMKKDHGFSEIAISDKPSAAAGSINASDGVRGRPSVLFHRLFAAIVVSGVVAIVLGLVWGLMAVVNGGSSSPVVYSSGVNATQALLFIGDSFTYTNDGMSTHVKAFAAFRAPSPQILACDYACEGGATFMRLWSLQFVHTALSRGHYVDQTMRYKYVVLQDDIPEYSDRTMDSFYAYGTMFVNEARKAGAEPVLFMAWAYTRLSWATMDAIAYAHRQVTHAACGAHPSG
jgi:hypothetical protein